MTDPIVPTPDSADNLNRCVQCGEYKPVTEFYREKGRANKPRTKCKACTLAYQREYRATHREEKATRDRLYAETHREAVAARKHAWYKANYETLIAQQREYREANHEASDAYQREYREANREKRRAYSRSWSKANPEKRRAQSHSRRAREKGAGGSFTDADIEAIRKAQGNRCYLCGKTLKKYHIDHFIPLAKGGTNNPGNLRLACPKCNTSKREKHPFELGRLL